MTLKINFNIIKYLRNFEFKVGLNLSRSESDYLKENRAKLIQFYRNILLDSFMTAAILDNEHKKNNSYSQLQSATPLNSLSQFVANFDFIDRANKQTEAQNLDLSKMVIFLAPNLTII